MSSTVASASVSPSTPQENEITTLIPDKGKLLSDLKAFTSHHETVSGLERKRRKESEKELEKATMEIAKLNTEIADWKNGAENLRKENATHRKCNDELTFNLLSTAEKNYQLEKTLKEKEGKISRLEQDIEKLDEFKQKVELAQRIFKLPIKNIKITSEMQLAISDTLNEESTNENGTGKSESSTSEQKYSTRGVHKAKRGRPF